MAESLDEKSPLEELEKTLSGEFGSKRVEPREEKSTDSKEGGTAALLALIGVLWVCLATVVSAEALFCFVRDGEWSSIKGLSGICLEAWIFDFAAALVVALLGWVLTNRMTVGCIAVIWGAWMLAIVSALKFRAVGKSLVRSDFALLSDVLGVAGSVISANVLPMIALGMLCVAAFVGTVVALRRSPSFPLKNIGRVALAILLGVQFFFGMELSFRSGTTGMFFRGDGVNGFLMNFLRSSRRAFQKPMGYSRERVMSVLLKGLNDTVPEMAPEEEGRTSQSPENSPKNSSISLSTFPVAPTEKFPDVLIYVGESFFDTNRLKNVTFNVDPTPNFHRILSRKGVLSGQLTSPERGGTTANVEFELMTGLPMAVFPESDVPYHSEIFRPIQALPKLFALSGVDRPLAFHNFYKEMFSYEEVYPRLGFQEFFHLAKLSAASFSGSGTVRYDVQAGKEVLFEVFQPSDEPLALALVNALSEQEAQRKFLFGLSIVSHGGFSAWPESQKTVRITSTGLPEASKEGLEHMANALERADRALGHVVDAVLAGNRPTLMFFMADHLPYADRRFFRDGGVDFGEDDLQAFAVPYFVLANFPLPKVEIPEGMSVFFLPAKILRAAGVDGGPFFRFLESKLRTVTALSHHVVIFPDGRRFAGPNDPKMPPEDAIEIQKLLEDFSLLTWDRLRGENYSGLLPI